MDMKKLHMGTMQFDVESMEELKTQLIQSFAASQADSMYTFKRHQGMAGRIKDIVCALSLCHNVFYIMYWINSCFFRLHRHTMKKELFLYKLHHQTK